MKKLVILFLSSFLLLNACKKKDSPTVVTPVTPTSPYYFKGTFNGTAEDYTQNQPEYMYFNANEAGGYQVANASLWPSFGLRLRWPSVDTVKESDVMGLIGKTLYFNDTLIHPEVSYDSTASSVGWLSTDTSNTTYNVKITNVTFLKKDTALGYPLRTYVITGTCTAVMTNFAATSILSGGSFNFIISRWDL